MKISVILIFWSAIIAILSAIGFGITLITWYNEDLWATAGFWIGLWLVIGGIPLYFGIKKVRHESQTS